MRPYPPSDLTESYGPAAFAASPDLRQWAMETFIEDGAELENPEHAHLQNASIGFLWTNELNEKRGRMLLGTCQLMPPTGEKWSAARAAAQIVSWFGHMPDFLITLYAPACSIMDDASFMALVEHELCHAAQKRDKYGAPSFDRETGDPIWAMRGHDVEEFVSVVERYGADASGVRAMVDAANAGAAIAPARIAVSCGNCLRLVS